MLNGKRIFVVMPAYNAARTLRQTCAELPRNIIDEVLVVDDRSSDSTVQLARELGLTTFVHHQNLGYGRNRSLKKLFGTLHFCNDECRFY